MEAGLEPAEVIGTSGGALIGALIAGGVPYEQLVQIVCGIRREDIFVPNTGALVLKGLGASSVLKPGPARAFLERVLPVRDFQRLKLPLRVTAVDVDHGELVVFGAGGFTDCTVIEAVSASMALPLYFPPVDIAGRRFVDGGLLAVLPLELAAEAGADLVVAVDVGPVAEGPPPWMPKSPTLLAAHSRALAITLADQKARTIAAWREDPRRPPLVLVEPAVFPHGTFMFDRTVDFIEVGYRAAHAALAERVVRR
jgi:predicted acylesterase/phospholipase RssA